MAPHSRKLVFEPPPGAESLDEIAWDADVLRVMLRRAIDQSGRTIADVVMMWTPESRRSGIDVPVSPPAAGGAPPRALSHGSEPEEEAPASAPRARNANLAFLRRNPANPPRRIRVHGGFTVSTITPDSLLERVGKRGLNRNDFLEALRTRLFSPTDPRDEPKMADLWINQVKPLAEQAFTSMLAMVRGENFYMEVGVLHFERWIGLQSSLTPAYIAKYVIPLKSRDQLKVQQRRVAKGQALAEHMTKQEAHERRVAKAIHDEWRAELKRGGRAAPPSPPRPSTTAGRRTMKGMDAGTLARLSAPRMWTGPPFQPMPIIGYAGPQLTTAYSSAHALDPFPKTYTPSTTVPNSRGGGSLSRESSRRQCNGQMDHRLGSAPALVMSTSPGMGGEAEQGGRSCFTPSLSSAALLLGPTLPPRPGATPAEEVRRCAVGAYTRTNYARPVTSPSGTQGGGDAPWAGATPGSRIRFPSGAPGSYTATSGQVACGHGYAF